MSNEIYVGAGTQATMIPESSLLLGSPTTQTGREIVWSDTTLILVPDIYIGCEVTFVTGANTTYYTITGNSKTSITLEADYDSTTHPLNSSTAITISKFGAPIPAPEMTINGNVRTTLLSDNWLGVVNTFTPPNVEVEMKQLNLAIAGTRNFSHQYKGPETVSDISLNNGSWLYYSLGSIDTVAHTATSDAMDGDSTIVTPATNSTKFFRAVAGNEYPPSTATGLKDIGTGTIAYTFKELNGPDLPSFSLDVSYNKASNTDRYVATTTGTDMFSRVFTGCQVNTLTLNFEEGQELKTTLDLVTRKAFDAPVNYTPHRQLQGAESLFNYDADATAPYMYSDGTVTLFGQTYARVKSGSLTINNNIAQQRYIGNTSRDTMSAHIPAQRTYDLSVTLLITDLALWNELRAQEEYDTDNGTIKLRFEKSADNFIEIELDDYLVSAVSVPFPDDRSAIEVEATINARTLTSCKYTGKWVILNDD